MESGFYLFGIGFYRSTPSAGPYPADLNIIEDLVITIKV